MNTCYRCGLPARDETAKNHFGHLCDSCWILTSLPPELLAKAPVPSKQEIEDALQKGRDAVAKVKGSWGGAPPLSKTRFK